jgi:DHA3 family macrolide efflux protein-like MFS transporter
MNNTLEPANTQANLNHASFGSMKTFFIVWIGQVVSILGSGMTGFALGVWIYQQTGSATSFALTLLFNMLPKAMVAPLAGVLADRYDRRQIMIATDLTAGIATLITAGLFLAGNLSIWHIYLLTAINASASAIQAPAFGAAVTQLVPKAQFGRANGLLPLGEGIGLVIAPVLAGVFIGLFGLASVLLVDMITFLFAVSTLILVHFPDFRQEMQQTTDRKKTWISQLGQAVSYLWTRPGLLGLVLAFTLVNFFVGAAEAVLTPMVLSFTTPENLGLILTVGGIGMLIGSLIITVFGNQQRKVYAAFGAYALLGVGVMLAGLRPSVILIGTAVFMAYLFLPTVMSSSQTILQAKVAPEIQGRVFGLRIFINTLSFAVAYLLGGTLADRIFEPLMANNGELANAFGQIIGTGPGRGMGLMFVLMGLLSIVAALGAFAHPRIRHLERGLPDMVEG